MAFITLCEEKDVADAGGEAGVSGGGAVGAASGESPASGTVTVRLQLGHSISLPAPAASIESSVLQ